jgi:hypothetical protein
MRRFLRMLLKDSMLHEAALLASGIEAGTGATPKSDATRSAKARPDAQKGDNP